MEHASKPLWKCPNCGHEFVTRNIWHSCGRYDIESHFKGRDAIVRETFDRLVTSVQKCGPVTVYAQKTRIVFMVRVRFGGVITRKHWLNFSLWLTRRIEHPLLRRVEVYGPASFGHQFRLASPDDVGSSLESLICEAYAVGKQDPLTRR